MIFYFSATGNSQYAAEKTAAALNSRIISIGIALKDGHFDYDVSDDDYVGFVLPTFAYTMPGAAARFIDRMNLTGYHGQYTFGIFTCGAGTGDECAALNAALKKKKMSFNGSFDVVMPDNFILWSNLPCDETLRAKLSAADRTIDRIIETIKSGGNGKISDKPPHDDFMPIEKISSSAGTSKFYATDKCVGCGTCVNLCPMSCISLKDASPVWEGECTMCLACLHRCPQGAVEYENQTRHKKRYQNPNCKPQLKNKY